MTYETLLVGLVVAFFYVEVTGLYPGGIIVPGYVALFLDRPVQVLVTLGVALLSLLTYRFLSRFLILFGKRRFVLLIFLGVLWSQAVRGLGSSAGVGPGMLEAIGWVIPGLLANHLQRQRFFPTLASMFTAATVTYFLVNVLARII